MYKSLKKILDGEDDVHVSVTYITGRTTQHRYPVESADADGLILAASGGDLLMIPWHAVLAIRVMLG